MEKIRLVIIIISLIISILYKHTTNNRYLKRHILKVHNIKISIIIPARNEEARIKKLIQLLLKQSYLPYEIIVVDDDSTDNTLKILNEIDDIKLIRLCEDPPESWVGKSWAIWNGYLKSKGDLLIFIDADVEPDEYMIESLVGVYLEKGGLISIWPYQIIVNLYEHLSLSFNIISIYASRCFSFVKIKPRSLFGPVVLTSKKDYEFTGGHEIIKGSIIEDISLGKLFLRKGIKINNYLGGRIIKFRMYPDGFSHLFEGFTKNVFSGAHSVDILSFFFAFLWIFGIYSSIFSINFSLNYLLIYFLFVISIANLCLSTGDYNFFDCLFYPVHFLFFLLVFIVSLINTLIYKKVRWRGRDINV